MSTDKTEDSDSSIEQTREDSDASQKSSVEIDASDPRFQNNLQTKETASAKPHETDTGDLTCADNSDVFFSVVATTGSTIFEKYHCGLDVKYVSTDTDILPLGSGSGAVEPPSFEGFQLLELLGKGSFGTVWKAFDNKLRRIVALKYLHGGGDRVRQRFAREAHLAAQLRHPCIVGIHDFVADHDPPYLSCEFVDGILLSEWRNEFDPDFVKIAEMLERIARAAHYAHQFGIIHRDLKPTNIVVDYNEIPHILDFGLAKGYSAEESLTVDGMLVGTPAYMSPEQITVNENLEPTCDVFSLGVILYLMLGRELPFRGKEKMVINQILLMEPTSLSKLDSQIPRDLEVICFKCMEKSPASRFQTAEELADELQRFRKKIPILSRPTGNVTKAFRWCNRNRLVSILGAAFLLSLIAGTVVSLLFAASARRNANKSLQVAYASSMSSVQHHIEEGRVHRAFEMLDRYQSPDHAEMRKWEWYFWHERAQSGLIWESNPTSIIDTLEPSPDGNWIAWADQDGALLMTSSRQGEKSEGGEVTKYPIFKIGQSDSGIRSLDWTPDSTTVVTGSKDGLIELWQADATQTSPPKLIADLEISVKTVRISPRSGDVFIACGQNKETQQLGKLARINLKTAEVVWEKEFDNVQISWLDVSKDESKLAYSHSPFSSLQGNYSVVVIDIESQQTIFTNSRRNNPTSCFMFDGNNRLIFNTRNIGGVYEFQVHDFAKETTSSLSRHVEEADCYNVDFNGQQICIGNERGSAVILQADLAKPQASFQRKIVGSVERVLTVAFSKDSKHVFTGGDDGKIRKWKNIDQSSMRPFATMPSHVGRIEINREGTLALAHCRHQPILNVYDLDTEKTLFSRHLPNLATVTGACFLSDNKIAIAGALEAEEPKFNISIWDCGKDIIELTLETDLYEPAYLNVSPDGKELLVAGGKTSMWPGKPVDWEVWDLATAERVLNVGGHRRTISDIEFSPDGKWIATSGSDRTVRLWNAKTKKEFHVWKPERNDRHALYFPVNIDFSNSGDTLAACYRNGTIVLHDLNSMLVSKVLSVDLPVTDGAYFIEDDQTLLVFSKNSNRITLLDVETGIIRSTLPVQDTNIASLDAVNNVVLTGDQAGAIRLHRISGSK